MKDEYKILYILVFTFCFSIVMGMFGVWAGKVDAQFVEGLITGSLVTLITMLFKDILGRENVPVGTTTVTPSTTTTTEAPKTGGTS